MDRLPTKGCEKGVRFTLADFLEAGRQPLGLELFAGGAGLAHEVAESITNRPGLAMTGFFDHFAWKRLQLVGNAEKAYSVSLSPKVREARFRALCARQAYCFIYTNGLKPEPGLVPFAEEHGIVLMGTPMETRLFVHHSTFVLERLGAPRTSLYGTMIEVGGLGVMIEGSPGLGKSETALGLIKRGNALVADDVTCIRKDVANNVLYASACDSTAGYMEIRGIGIINVPSVFGINSVRDEKQLQFVITFKRLSDVIGEIDRIGQTLGARRILGVEVPNVILPVSEGRDLVNLVETAVQQQKLILAGYDPVESLSEHLRARADGRGRDTGKTARKGQRHG